MTKHSTARAALVVLAVWLAGCAGGGSQTEASDDDQVEPPAADFSGSTGAIEGFVVDDTLLPIGNAAVSLQVSRTTAVLANATTGPDGRFVFSRVDPGTYLVTVQATGYGDGSSFVQVTAGEAAELRVTVDDLPSNDPYVDTFIEVGILRCAFSYVAFADTCTIEAAMGENRNQIDFNISAGHQWIIDETYWDDSSVTMDHDFFVREPDEEPRGTIVGRG